MNKQTQEPQTKEYENFMDLARKLLAVPKKELDEKLKEFRERPHKKRGAA